MRPKQAKDRHESRSGQTALIVLFAVCAIGLFPGRGEASTPRTGEEMLQNGIDNLHGQLAKMLADAREPGPVLASIRTLVDTRRLAQRVTALDFPLDDFAGIVFIDRYDEEFVGVVDSLVTHFTFWDKTIPSAEAGAVFRERLGTIPALNSTPAAFIIAYLVGRCAATGDGLPETMDETLRKDVQETAIRSIGAITAGYLETRTGRDRLQSDEFWHQSVVERMKCPNHRTEYETAEVRNGLRPDGTLYRRLVVTCTGGQESRNLNFDLGEFGKLTRSGGRQRLQKPLSSPAKRMPGVAP